MIRAYMSRRQYICAVPLLASPQVLIRTLTLRREGKLMADGKLQPLLRRFSQCRRSPGREESSKENATSCRGRPTLLVPSPV